MEPEQYEAQESSRAKGVQRRKGCLGGGNSLRGAASELSFARREGDHCDEWRWSEASEGGAADTQHRGL